MSKILDRLGFNKKTFFCFLLISSNSELIYAFTGMRSVLYDPLVEALHVTNTQFGILMGFIGFITTFGGISVGWLQDRFPIRNVLGVNSLMYGIWALIMSLWPECPFALKCLFFISFGFNGDAMYWATVLKSVRVLAKDDHQATAFGMLESVRGILGLAAKALPLIIFTALGSTMFGMRAAMLACACITLLSSLSIWLFLPKDPVPVTRTEKPKTKTAFTGFLKVLRMPEVWMTGLAASCVYAAYCAVSTYFVPYLQNVYILPAALVGVFGIVNGSATRIISSPIAGLISDMKFKSSAHMMRTCYGVLIVFLLAALLLPKTTSLVLPAMGILLLIAVFSFLIRGVYYAPIGESGVPAEVSAAAMAVAACIGYSPSFWAYPLYGFLIDSFAPEQAYRMIFIVILCLAILGFILTTALGRRIVAKQNLKATIQTSPNDSAEAIS